MFRRSLFFLGDNEIVLKIAGSYQVLVMFTKKLSRKAQFIFFSSDKSIGRIYEFWKWNKSLRLDRFLKELINEDRLFTFRKENKYKI